MERLKEVDMGKMIPFDTDEKSLNLISMIAISFVIGIFAGFGAILFKGMIGFVHNLSFSGKLNVVFDVYQHAAKSVWGIGFIFVPVLGAVIVCWLTQKFAPEARGHGVPEVMNAIYYNDGKIRPIVALVKSICSSISIGTGGSVGREGPIIQIGAAFGSFMGQFIKMAVRQRVALIAAGAAAGIAATFNTPIGGLAFAIELMLVSVSAVNVVIVSVATVTATIISRAILGVMPSFFVPSLGLPLTHALSPFLISVFLPFGIVMGVAAALFTHTIYWVEDHSAQLIKNPYARHMSGMFVLGIMLYATMMFSGHYYAEGVGYSTIMDVLEGVLTSPWFLLMLFVLKLLATGLTLGTGASGGVFSPSLFMGATLGAAYGGFVAHMFPGLHVSLPLFAVAGMAAMVAGSTGAVLTAIIMTVEQTRDYADILPIILSVAIAYVVRVKITTESIYTLKLYRRGFSLPQGLQAAISVTKRAKQVMDRRFEVIDTNGVDAWAQQEGDQELSSYAIVTSENQMIGVINRDLGYLMADVDVRKLIDTGYSVISENTTWPVILREMTRQGVKVILVSKLNQAKTPTEIVGVITQAEIISAAHQQAKFVET